MEIIEITLENIEPDENQPRKDITRIGTLCSSIMKHGLIQPIEVRKVSNGKYVIVDGERRYRAFKLLNKEKIKSIVNNDINDIYMRQLVSDFHKEKLNLVEQSEAIQKLEESGYNRKEIMFQLGLCATKFNTLRRIRNFNNNTKKHIIAGTITQSILSSLSKHDIRPEFEDVIIKDIVEKRKKSDYQIDTTVLEHQNIKYHVNNYLKESYIFEKKSEGFKNKLVVFKELLDEEIKMALKSNCNNLNTELAIIRDRLSKIISDNKEMKEI